MTADPSVIPGLSLLAVEFLVLAAVGYVVARVALRQTDGRLALAQGLIIGPAIWGLLVNFALYLLPGIAGALAGWVAMFALGAGLARRAPSKLSLRPRTVAGFVAAGLALSWIALAGRQLLTIPDPSIHLALSAAIRAGVHPPELPWNPGAVVPYHYGVDLLIGLLMPPSGPDIALTTELLGAYMWTSFALVVATTLRSRRSWLSALVLAPLLLTAGAWTLLVSEPPALLKIPVPSGIPAAGLRAALGSIYWPTPELPGAWSPYYETPPPNVWKPPFPLAYALSVIVLERVAAQVDQRWLGRAGLALLIGFLGMIEETVALTVLGLWLVLAVLATAQGGPGRVMSLATIQRWFSGPGLALILLVTGGGPVTGVLIGGLGGSLSLQRPGSLDEPRLWASFQPLTGGVGVLGVGGIPVAVAALALAWRQRLVLALTIGSGVFMLAALTLQFGAFQFDVGRLDGHARNFALLALLVALGIRLHALRPRWRYAAAGGLMALIVWPTIATPVHKVRLALDRGIELANAAPAPPTDDVASLQHMGRHVLQPFATENVAAYIRDRTTVDSRILSPDPINMSIHTGRPSAAGFAGHVHLFPFTGPDYEDAIRSLEPAALRRHGFSYVHATQDWMAGLPGRAQAWLADPKLFTPVIRDGPHTLFRIEPAFLAMNPAPAPQSFEALRQVVPGSANVQISAGIQSIPALRVAAILPHARLSGSLTPSNLYLLTEIPIDPASESPPDVVVVARDRAMNASTHAFQPIWWNHAAIAYATSPNAAAIAPPPQPESNFVVRISDVRRTANRFAFAVTFMDQASDRWTGQDWLLIEVDPGPWSLPTRYAADGYTLVGARWYAGQIAPSGQPTSRRYVFDSDTHQLAVQGADGALNIDGALNMLPSSGDRLSPGAYVLAVRLRHNHLQAAVVPVLKMMIAGDGHTSYETFPGNRKATVDPCPQRLRNTDSCRRLASDS